MFLSYKIIFVRLRKSYSKLRAKRYYSISIILQWPRFISHEKTLNARSNGHLSLNKLLLRYTNTSKESSLDGFLKALISFDLYNYNLSKLLKQFRVKKSCNKSYKRQSGTLLVKSIIKEKSYKETTNIK
jgi:hypothetical protein